jgi:hypothetical protein
MFLIMRLRTLPGVLGRPTPNLALITGTDIDRAKLSRLVSNALPPATLSFDPAAHRGGPHRRDQPVAPPRSHRPAAGAVTG